jgi:CelD/BcsL family acetyltransferase involved in cellulose biosynthesis
VSRASGVCEDRVLQVSLAPCPAPQELAPQWRALQAQADPNFFTGWTWIGCWLAHLSPAHRPVLVRVHQGVELVGLGVLVPQRTRRLRWWPSQALHLHATGLRELDDISVEHNGWLARRGLAEQVQAAVADQLWALAPAADQLCVSRVSAAQQGWHAAPRPVAQVREHSEPAYRADLSALRASGRAFLDTLGTPTRAAIRRSLRLYEGLGALRLSQATEVGQGLAFLDRLKHFHQAAWTARGRPGAFANPLFERFHRHLVATALPAGQVELLRVLAGNAEVGYLYNFVEGGQVLAYQSGFHFGLTERNHHPGLVIHALAVQRALDAGLDRYDFLAGQARYKQQLSHQTYAMTSFTLHRHSPGLWLEEAWRRARGRFTAPARLSS